MYHSLSFAATAAALTATSATAETFSYAGTVRGTIDSGIVTYDSRDGHIDLPPGHTIIDLAGKLISIDFTTDVTPNYFDEYQGVITKIYNTVLVSIPVPGPFDDWSSRRDNTYDYTGSTDFTGDASAGMFQIYGSVYLDDSYQAVKFNFANTSSSNGPLTGGGTASGYNFTYGDEAEYSDIKFTLTSGFVTGPGQTAFPPASSVPEPATWAMMITGLGFVGATMRRRSATFHCGS